MKILYLTISHKDINSLPYGETADYMSDLLFMGFRELFGGNCVDFPKKNHLYIGYENKGSLWGKGFGYAAKLKDIPVDRALLCNKIDLIVISVHHTAHHNQYYVEHVLKNLCSSNSKVIVVDGHDLQSGYHYALKYTPYVFKREIADGENLYIPINFAIPKDLIVDSIQEKTKFVSDLLPADHNHPNRVTHIYNNEEDYYDEYAKSWFCVNVKKGGYDSFRPYEILAQGSIPIFGDIENCPSRTLTSLPKELLTEIKAWPFLNLPGKIFTKSDIKMGWNYVNEAMFNKQLCLDTIQYLLEYTRKNLTTEALAKYVLEAIV